MTGKKSKIHIRILTSFSIILLLSFFLTGLIFNIVARQYIQISAVEQLNETYNNMTLFIEQAETFIEKLSERNFEFSPLDEWQNSPFYNSIRQNAFQINVNIFIIDDEYNLPYRRDISDEVFKIVQGIKDKNIHLAALKNVLVRTNGSSYFVSAFQTPVNSLLEQSFFIIYANVTGLISFAAKINSFLIILVCVMFIGTVVIAFFLSNTITRPIKKISLFASKIGYGDFTPNNYLFADEELDNLNKALNNTAKQLSIYDNEQKLFFQNVSHELRTPLMSIHCYAEGISCGIMEPQKASKTILSETLRLSELVSDLLYISKIDNITTVYETVKTDLFKLIKSCVERQILLAQKNGIIILIDFIEPSVEYECVDELISRALDNLFSNAIRYASGEITVSCRRSHNQITICVSDDGCGIEPESMPHIFERFYKGRGGNHGIGLSIVKSIVEQHKGAITAKNNIKGGAEFTITLPIIIQG